MDHWIAGSYCHARICMTARAVYIRCYHRGMIRKTDAAACAVMTVGAGGAAGYRDMMRIYCGRGRCYIMTGRTRYRCPGTACCRAVGLRRIAVDAVRRVAELLVVAVRS